MQGCVLVYIKRFAVSQNLISTGILGYLHCKRNRLLRAMDLQREQGVTKMNYKN